MIAIAKFKIADYNRVVCSYEDDNLLKKTQNKSYFARHNNLKVGCRINITAVGFVRLLLLENIIIGKYLTTTHIFFVRIEELLLLPIKS